MSRSLFVAALFAGVVTLPALAADGNYHAMPDLLASTTAKEILTAPVTLYWINQPHPPLAEQSRLETYTRTSFSPGPFGGGRRHCVDAFEQTLKGLVDDAVRRGYDLLVGVRPVVNDKPLDTAEGFTCKPGYKITSVSLQATFGMSDAALQRAAEAERASLTPTTRPTPDGVIRMSLTEALASPEAKAALGSGLSATGYGAAIDASTAASFRFRAGPDDYAGEADLKPPTTREAACTTAVAQALSAMAEEARPRGYTKLLRIRSRLDDAYAQTPAELECRIYKRSVAVTLQASLASDE